MPLCRGVAGRSTALRLRAGARYDRLEAQQSKLYVGMVLILIIAEALGLYGLIVGLFLSSMGGNAVCGV